MVAKIISGKSIRGMLQYNENKVSKSMAQLLLASGFAADVAQMSLHQKLQRFQHLTMLTDKVKTNAIHISLNLDSQDKLNNEQLQQITITYMEKIGFGDQPYLVYRHNDAAHPHLHIATTNIKSDGRRIDIHDIGRKLSEPARKELEIEFKLIRAEGRRLSNSLKIKPADLAKVDYGKSPTKRAITNIVNAVVGTYKFTSLAEMNAVLKQFNVIANRGRENTLMFQKNGLMYSIINEKGEQVGVPIKASSIYNKPTMANLERRFSQNHEKRQALKEPLKETINDVFDKYTTISKATFISELAKQNINVVFRQNEQGFAFGITFIDNNRKTVFNGSDLGKGYAVKAITERFGISDKLIKPELKTYLKPPTPTNYLKRDESKSYLIKPEEVNLLKGFLSKPAQDFSFGAHPKKKKKKKGQQNDQQQSL
ncbi:relaxase/mobilization nuclease domain-containing protein [Pedobacter sp. P351]|uniref:relaxase/mobilization nuclease domain-containing protein n=1 Tax=Pedobacter superstes TaxID=3133441 RepID=UPI0030A5BFD5